MRKLASVMVSGLLAACGVFGTADEPKPDESQPPPATPQDNAQPPPINGTAPAGVYVSASKGAEDGSGSASRPLKTLKAAFAAAKERGLRVIACAEEYPESITLIDGVSAYGYYECTGATWTRSPRRAIVRAPSSPAAIARGLTQPTRLEGFELRSPDLDGTPTAADDPNAGTSIALEVRDSQGLSLAELLVHAGKGSPGTDGTPGALNSRTAASIGKPAKAQQEVSFICGIAGAPCTVPGVAGGVTTCAIGPSGGPGGLSGDGRWYVDRVPAAGVSPEYRGRPLVATTQTAVGGLNDIAAHGLPGAQGAAGADGVDGANGVAALKAVGFVRGDGSAGTAGEPGQGGGGGAGTGVWFYPNGGLSSPPAGSTNALTSTGGGGGGGGCPGQPGTPATGGGASIGALVVNSVVTIERTRIEGSDGGRAGRGTLGMGGVIGASGGPGVYTVTGDGGHGGAGGNGGASGHGAAGPSYGLAYTGALPALSDVELVAGAGGAGQPQLKGVVPPNLIGQWNAAYETKTLAAVPAGDSRISVEILP